MKNQFNTECSYCENAEIQTMIPAFAGLEGLVFNDGLVVGTDESILGVEKAETCESVELTVSQTAEFLLLIHNLEIKCDECPARFQIRFAMRPLSDCKEPLGQFELFRDATQPMQPCHSYEMETKLRKRCVICDQGARCLDGRDFCDECGDKPANPRGEF